MSLFQRPLLQRRCMGLVISERERYCCRGRPSKSGMVSSGEGELGQLLMRVVASVGALMETAGVPTATALLAAAGALSEASGVPILIGISEPAGGRTCVFGVSKFAALAASAAVSVAAGSCMALGVRVRNS